MAWNRLGFVSCCGKPGSATMQDKYTSTFCFLSQYSHIIHSPICARIACMYALHECRSISATAMHDNDNTYAMVHCIMWYSIIRYDTPTSTWACVRVLVLDCTSTSTWAYAWQYGYVLRYTSTVVEYKWVSSLGTIYWLSAGGCRSTWYGYRYRQHAVCITQRQIDPDWWVYVGLYDTYVIIYIYIYMLHIHTAAES